MPRRWGQSLVVLVCGLAVAVPLLLKGALLAGVSLLLIFVLAAAVTSPRAFPRSLTDTEARARSAADGRPIVYWRPGCPFCIRLRASLGASARRLHWVDIWADPDGAASVRTVTGGDETVPTVVAPGESYVNPAPSLVRSLASR